MDKLSDVIGGVFYHFILKPKMVVEDKLDIYIIRRLNTKLQISLFLITLAVIVLILPLIIVYRSVGMADLTLYSVGYLLLFFISIVVADGVIKASIRAKNIVNWKPLTISKLRKEINVNSLAENLIANKIFEAEQSSLERLLSNKKPKSRINIIHTGGSGRVSYHSVFFIFSHIIEGDIEDMNNEKKSEILSFIQTNFLKGGKEIQSSLLEQAFNDWKKKKYSPSNQEHFLSRFL